MVGEKPAGGAGHDLLTPEQQAMWRSRHIDEANSLNPEQKKAFNTRLRQKVKAMGDAELARTRMALQAEWDALPASRREKIERRIAQKGQAGEGKPGKGEGAAGN